MAIGPPAIQRLLQDFALEKDARRYRSALALVHMTVYEKVFSEEIHASLLKETQLFRCASSLCVVRPFPPI